MNAYQRIGQGHPENVVIIPNEPITEDVVVFLLNNEEVAKQIPKT